MTMKIDIKDQYVDQFEEFLKSLPEDAVVVNNIQEDSISFEDAKVKVQNAIDNIEEYRINLNQFAVKDSRQFIVALRQQQDALRGYGITFSQLTRATTEIRENLNEYTQQMHVVRHSEGK